MTIEDIREMLVEELTANQRNSSVDDSKNLLVYTIAYNDGLISMADRIIDKLRQEEVINK